MRARACRRRACARRSPTASTWRPCTRSSASDRILETNPLAMKDYQPANYDESEGLSPARLREALAHSVNVAAVHTLERVRSDPRDQPAGDEGLPAGQLR